MPLTSLCCIGCAGTLSQRKTAALQQCENMINFMHMQNRIRLHVRLRASSASTSAQLVLSAVWGRLL